MGQTPEGKVKAKVRKLFAEFGTKLFYFCPVQAGYGKPGLDFHCNINGWGFAVETKIPGSELTARQEITKAQIEQSGTPVFVVRDDTDIEELRTWLLLRAMVAISELAPDTTQL